MISYLKYSSFLILTILSADVYSQSTLSVQDTRTTPTDPTSYSRSFEPHFKEGIRIGLPDTYYTILGLRGWSDNSGGKAHELAFSSNDKILVRSGFSPTWEGWRKILIADVNENVGVGTESPKSRLHIYQSAMDQSGLIVQGNTVNTDLAQHYVAITLDGDYGNGTGNYSQIRSYSNLYNTWGSQLAFYTTATGVVNTIAERMRIDANGNVGIGTTDPKGYKLAVAGNMIAESVKVKLQGTWPDYVFAKGYKLPTLQETEKHIKDKGHLPGIPPAAEIKANGIDLGEMNAKLLQKIEELTLHLIRQQKEIEQLKERR